MATSKIISTRYIQRTLKEFAAEHHYKHSSLDFTLVGVQTYFKSCHHESYIKFHDNYKKEYKDPKKLIDDRVEFIQLYKIKIHSKKKSELNLKYTLERGEFSTYPMMIISPDSEIPTAKYGEVELLKLIYTQVNKIKALNRFMVNLFSSCMVSDLKTFVSKLYEGAFTQSESILLFEGIDPEISEPSKVIEHYKEKSTQEKVVEVEDSELIITYEKPIYGEAGLNALGQRIFQGDVKNIAKIEYDIDTSSIRVQESPTQIRYYSKKRGFVSILNNTLSISNKIVVQNIKRSEAKLTKKEENEVSVVISQTDVTRDGLGEGVELKSESVHVTGHMGAKSSIEAKEVIIDGATHNEAFITAKTVKVNRHKGTIRCHKAEITSLEGGTIYATYVKVNAALGGTICAEHVSIKSLKHNLKVFASKSITIERILGEDNHLVIDYRKLPVLQSKLHFLNEEAEQLKWKYEDALKHSLEKRPALKQELEEKNQEIEDITFCHYNAVITIMAPITGLNTIEFAVVDKQTSLIYRTKEAKSFEPFSLRKSEDKITLEPVNISIDI